MRGRGKVGGGLKGPLPIITSYFLKALDFCPVGCPGGWGHRATTRGSSKLELVLEEKNENVDGILLSEVSIFRL